MRKTRTLRALLYGILAALLFLNGFLFYAAQCRVEYVQNVSAWGKPQTIRLEDLLALRRLIAGLPADVGSAREGVENLLELFYRERNRGRWGSPKPEDLELSETAEALRALGATQERCEEVRSLLVYVDTYPEYIRSLVDGADALSGGFAVLSGDPWILRNIAKGKRDYYGLGGTVLSPVLDYGLNTLLHSHFSDLFALLAAVCCALLLAAGESGTEAGLDLAGDPGFDSERGLGWGAGWSEQAAGSTPRYGLLLFVCTSLFYLTNAALTARFLGLEGLSYPLQSFRAFAYCPYDIRAGIFLALWTAMKSALALLVFAALSAVLLRRHFWHLLPLGSIAAVEWLLSRYNGEEPVRVALREVNLFSALSFERFFNRYLNLNFAGIAVDRPLSFLGLFGICFAASLLAFVRSRKAYHAARRTEAMEAFYGEVDRRYRESRQIYHDFHNHLLAIRVLNEAGDRDGMERYLSQLTEQLVSTLMPANTGSRFLDRFLYQKSRAAAEQGVALRIEQEGSLDACGVTEFDLCTVFGNLIDNAAEAIVRGECEDREIALTIQVRNRMLFLACENAYRGTLRRTERGFGTSKRDAGRHGIGLESVRRVCRKYDGTSQIRTEDGRFRIELLLNRRDP